MHSVKVILGGLALWCALFAGRAWLAPRISSSALFVVFSVIWFCASAINLSIGMERARYSLIEELPYFLLVFGVPMIAALISSDR